MSISNVTITPVQNALERIWLGIGAIIVAIAVMWIFNILGWQWVIIPIALVGSLLIVMVGFKASLLVNFGLFGAFISLLQDKDKSQGVTTGFIWLTNLVVALGLAFVLSAFTLMTWSFKQSPGAFWILFFGITLILLVQQHYKIKTSWAAPLISGYAVICIIVAGFGTFGGAYTGNSFDPKTGEPRYMVDPKTGTIVDGIKPSDCRPLIKNMKPPHVSAEGIAFDYAGQGTCYSPETGRRAVPMTEAEAVKRNPTAWAGSISQAVDAMSLPAWLKGWWLPALITTVVVALLFWWWNRRSSKSTTSGGGKVITSFFDGMAGFAIIATGCVAILIALFIVADLFGVFDSLTRSSQDWNRTVKCTTNDDLAPQRGGSIDTGGKEVTFCAGREVLFVHPVYGKQLAVEFSPTFLREHGHVLEGRTMADFVTISPPMTYPGSNTLSWRLTESLPQERKNTGWVGSGLRSVTLTVKAID